MLIPGSELRTSLTDRWVEFVFNYQFLAILSSQRALWTFLELWRHLMALKSLFERFSFEHISRTGQRTQGLLAGKIISPGVWIHPAYTHTHTHTHIWGGKGLPFLNPVLDSGSAERDCRLYCGNWDPHLMLHVSTCHCLHKISQSTL